MSCCFVTQFGMVEDTVGVGGKMMVLAAVWVKCCEMERLELMGVKNQKLNECIHFSIWCSRINLNFS